MRKLLLLFVSLAIGWLTLFQSGHSVTAQGPPTAAPARKFVLPAQPVTPRPAFDRKSFVASSAVYWSGWTADYLTTRRALAGNPRAFERNGLARRGAVYWGTAAGGYAATVWLERRHPKIARWVRFGVGTAHLGAAAYNLRQ